MPQQDPSSLTTILPVPVPSPSTPTDPVVPLVPPTSPPCHLKEDIDLIQNYIIHWILIVAGIATAAVGALWPSGTEMPQWAKTVMIIAGVLVAAFQGTKNLINQSYVINKKDKP
jgi:hypothetical protein